MHRDFDDFSDEFDQIRQQHSSNLDHDQYGEDYDPNSESFYDLETLSPDYPKSLFFGLGDLARYKGFNRVGEQIPLADYLDEGGNSIVFPEDNPHDLYHRNNQTILDPSTMPDTPVDPKQFVSRVTEELTVHKVLISDKMPGLLECMCRLFNFSIQPNRDLPRTIKNLVFPAETGTGKSVSVQVYVSLLEKHSSVIVVSKVEEAIKYCETINKLAKDNDYARCYYSVTEKNKDDPLRVEAPKLRDYRCIVITHNMFRIVNSESLQPSQKPGNQNPTEPANSYIQKADIVEYFGAFDKRPRDFISIDEKLSFYEQFTLDYKELDQLISNVESAVQESSQLGAFSTSHKALQVLKEFKDFLLFKEDKIVTSSNSLVVKELTKKAEADLIANGEPITFSDLSSQERHPIKLTNLKDKDAAAKILRSHHIEMQTRQRNVIGISSREVERMGDSIRRDADSFYRERFDPPIGNCLPSWIQRQTRSLTQLVQMKTFIPSMMA